MENMEKGNHILTNCTIDSATVKDLLDHLGVHGLMSLVASRKFAPYFNCVLRELDKAITEVDTPVAPTAGDGNGVSRDPASSAVNGPALLPTDGKMGGEIRAGTWR